MKTLFFTASLFLSVSLMGQVTDGSIAPDFTLTDINGNTHHLYDYLDQGKTVFLDFSAAHCPSCWAYHSQHDFSTLYNEHGPNGTISQDIMAIFIEFDPNNGTNELLGISGATQGNWVSGSPYPFINPEGADRTTLFNDYQVNYFAMIYAICPDKKITLTGKKTAAELYSHVSTCASIPTDSTGTDSTTTIIKDMAFSQSVKISFNASSNLLKTEGNLENYDLSVFDVSGKLIISKRLTNQVESTFVGNITNGIYFYRLVKDRDVKTGKFIK